VDVVAYDGLYSGDATYLFNLTFEAGKDLKLYVYKKDGEWFPAMIEHPRMTSDCPLCGTSFSTLGCEKFRPLMQKLFEEVMNHPEIRVRKMFI